MGVMSNANDIFFMDLESKQKEALREIQDKYSLQKTSEGKPD